MPQNMPEPVISGLAVSLNFIHVDEHLIVVEKPPGLLAVPGRGEDKQDCLSSRVQAAYADALIVHRLDMSTSGLMLMARGSAMQRALSKCFERRSIHKRYVAVVEGLVDGLTVGPQEGLAGAPHDWQSIDMAIAADWPRRPLRVIDQARGKPSQTRWRIISQDRQAGSTRLQLEPVTGRSHQLRVHLQALGHPILGDALYGSEAGRLTSARLLLHATSLAFPHPHDGRILRFESAPDF